jgi:hypothetical protein
VVNKPLHYFFFALVECEFSAAFSQDWLTDISWYIMVLNDIIKLLFLEPGSSFLDGICWEGLRTFLLS